MLSAGRAVGTHGVEGVSSPYIVGPFYDRVFFIYSPLIALALGLVLSQTALADYRYTVQGVKTSVLSLFGGALTMAHLFIVVFRSHLNPSIFAAYRRRLIWPPLLVFAGMMLSSWFLILAFVVTVWWDVYHSALQTFGLGRLYDKKAGNYSMPAETLHATSHLDRGINLLLYAGPIFAGASLVDHAVHFEQFASVGSPGLAKLAFYANAYQPVLALATVGLGIPYLLYYLYAYARLRRSGYNVPVEKVILLASTALCSIWAWGFNPFGQAFFIMNFFHAVQYFALVWWSEKRHFLGFLGWENSPRARVRALALFLLTAAGYGLWAECFGRSSHLAVSITLTVSLMHFWFDGFVWSVSKKEI